MGKAHVHLTQGPVARDLFESNLADLKQIDIAWGRERGLSLVLQGLQKLSKGHCLVDALDCAEVALVFFLSRTIRVSKEIEHGIQEPWSDSMSSHASWPS